MTITKKNRWVGGRGFSKHCFTIEDIAKARGKTVDAVRKDISRKKFYPDNLESMNEYLNKGKKK